MDIVGSPDIVLTSQQRADELDDMVGTTGTAFLGLTLGCARCHSHKFDPISHREYYSMAAVFAGVRHGERALPLPKDRKEELARADDRIKELETQLAAAREAKQIQDVLRLQGELRLVSDPLGSLFSDSGIQVLIVIPSDFKANLDRLRGELAKRGADAPLTAVDYPRPVIVQNSADERSVIAHNRVTEVLDEWERSLLREYLRDSGLPENLPTPV